MSAGIVLSEWPENRRGSHVRYRMKHHRTKAKARCWLELTNQPGDRQWIWMRDLYSVEVRSGSYRVETDSRYSDQPPLSRSSAVRLADDIRWLAATSRPSKEARVAKD